MIQFVADIECVDDGSITSVVIPSKMVDMLDRSRDYIIVDTVPMLGVGEYEDIFAMNEAIRSMNEKNPDMTTEYLDILLENTCCSITDDEFIRKIVEKDFLFDTIEDFGTAFSPEERAAYYLSVKLRIPFDEKLDASVFEHLKGIPLDCIDWYRIWELYESNDFVLVEDFSTGEYGEYVMKW